MPEQKYDPTAVRQRITEGLRTAIRREVDRRRRLGLPIIVQENGRIIDLQTGLPPEPLTTPTPALITEFDDEPAP
ncbi:MAG TPA: hypothetical protein VGM03_17035 [Phycisphaerae bacterium]